MYIQDCVTVFRVIPSGIDLHLLFSSFHLPVSASIVLIVTSPSVSMMCPQWRASWWSWSADWGGLLPCRSCGTERTNKYWTPMTLGYYARVSACMWMCGSVDWSHLELSHQLDFILQFDNLTTDAITWSLWLEISSWSSQQKTPIL